MKKIRPIYAAVAVAAVALAACTSSGGGNASSSSAAPSSTAPAPVFTGEVKIGIISDTSTVSATGNPEPETVSAVNAHVAVLNAAGGINGKKVVLEACDEKGDPNVAANCARKFVADGVVSTVGEISVYGPKYGPILQEAGIPRLGPLAASQAEFNADNSYPISGGAPVQFEGAILNAIEQGKKTMFMLGTQAEGSESIVALLKPMAEKAGMKWAGQLFIPPGTPDVSSYITKAKNAGADFVLATFGPDTTLQVMKTAKQLGATYALGGAAESFNDDMVAAMGKGDPLVQTAIMASPFPPVTQTQIAGVKQYQTEMDAAAAAGDKHAGADIRSHVFAQWMAAYAFGAIAKTITGEITAKSFTTALNTVKDVPMLDAIPPWTPSKSGGLLARISNPYGWYIKFDANGKQTLLKDQAVDILGLAAGTPSS